MEKAARKVPKDQRPSFGKGMRVFGMGHGRVLATMSASTSCGSGPLRETAAFGQLQTHAPQQSSAYSILFDQVVGR
jgi:hypothetical protein